MKKLVFLIALWCVCTIPSTAQIQIPPVLRNASSTGTSAGHLVKLTGTPSTAVITTAGDSSGVIGVCDSTCGTSDSPNISNSGVDTCAFDGATTAGDYVQISATTNGDCHDTGSAAVPTSGQIIGRVLNSIGSSGSASIIFDLENSVGGGGGGSGGVNAGSVGFEAAYNSTSTVSSIPLSIAVDAISGAGIGAAPVAWASATTYPLCQVVSSSGNYIAVSGSNNNITPGSNSHIWFPIPNGSRPTQFDCGFYIAQSLVTSTIGVNLKLGFNSYTSCIGMTYPTVSAPGQPGVNIHGAGVGSSIIQQTCNLNSGAGGDGLAMLNVPPATTDFILPRLQFSDFTLDANGNAPGVLDLHACQQCEIRNMDFRNATAGSDHYFEAGTIGGGARGYVYELTMENVSEGWGLAGGGGHGNGAATFTVAVNPTGGIPTITVTNGGTGYSASQMAIRLVRSGGLEACTSVGTFTPAVASGVITGITTTSTGCAATGQTFVQLYPQTNVAYGFKFSTMTDSHFISALTPGGVGATCGIFASDHTGSNVFFKLHPISTFNGVCDSGNDDYYGTQVDSVYNWGFDFEGQSTVNNIYGSHFQWNNTHYEGSSDYHFGQITGAPTTAPIAINIFGDGCVHAPQQDAYGHFVDSVLGTVDSGFALPAFVNVYQSQYCNQIGTNTVQPTNIAQTVVWSNGRMGNNWLWGMGSGGNAVLSLQNTIGNAASLQLQQNIAATSGANRSSMGLATLGNYWNGSVSTPYGAQLQTTFAAGSNPLATHAFTGTGTAPSGGDAWTFDGPVALLTGSTGVTQTTGDATTKLATDAFVINSIAAGAVGCTPSGTTGTIQASNGSGACQATALADSGSNITSTEPILAPSATLGTSGTSVGSVAFNNATSGSITLSPTTGALGTVTATLPANTGTLAELNLAQTWTAAQTNSTAGTASTPGLSITGAPFTGGSGTTTTPQLYLNAGTAPTTWSTAGTMFGVNAPSGFTGNLFNFFVNGGSSLFSLSSSGTLTMANTINAAGSIFSGGNIGFSSKSKMFSSTDGNITLQNSAGTSFSQLQFGGTSASFPSLQVSGTTLKVELANLSGLAPLQASQLTTTTFTVSGLPSASTAGAGAMVVVTDATTFTPGTCTGGGSDYMIAVSNGSTWSCH